LKTTAVDALGEGPSGTVEELGEHLAEGVEGGARGGRGPGRPAAGPGGGFGCGAVDEETMGDPMGDRCIGGGTDRGSGQCGLSLSSEEQSEGVGGGERGTEWVLRQPAVMSTTLGGGGRPSEGTAGHGGAPGAASGGRPAVGRDRAAGGRNAIRGRGRSQRALKFHVPTDGGGGSVTPPPPLFVPTPIIKITRPPIRSQSPSIGHLGVRTLRGTPFSLPSFGCEHPLLPPGVGGGGEGPGGGAGAAGGPRAAPVLCRRLGCRGPPARGGAPGAKTSDPRNASPVTPAHKHGSGQRVWGGRETFVSTAVYSPSSSRRPSPAP